MEIIDCHTHAWTPEDWAALKQSAAFLDGGLEEDSPYNWTPRFEGDLDLLVRAEAEAGVDRFVLLPVTSRPERSETLNRWAAAAAKSRPQIIPFGTLHPYSSDLKSDLELVLDLGLPAVKLHSLVQRFDPLSDQAFRAYELLEKAGLPILMDSMDLAGAAELKPNLAPFVDAAREMKIETRPEKIRVVTEKFPGLKIIAAHLGCLYGWNQVHELFDCDRVWFDLSYIHRLLSPEEVMEIINHKGPDRIVFGTDAPYRRPQNALNWVLELPLDPEDLAGILAGNLKLILGI